MYFLSKLVRLSHLASEKSYSVETQAKFSSKAGVVTRADAQGILQHDFSNGLTGSSQVEMCFILAKLGP